MLMMGFIREAAPGRQFTDRRAGAETNGKSPRLENWQITFVEWDGEIRRLNLENYR